MTCGFRRFLVPLSIGLLAVLFASAGLQAPLSAVPGSVAFTTKGGTVSLTLNGPNAKSVTSLRVRKNGVVDPKFKAVRPKAADLAAGPHFGLAASPGVAVGTDYRLEALSGKTWTLVQCSISVRAAGTKLAPIRIGGPLASKKSLIPEQTLIGNILANKYIGTPVEAARTSKLRAAVEKMNANAPQILDWYPKEKGAIGGTLVLIGQKLDGVLSVSLGSANLSIVKRNKNFNSESLVVQLPNSVATGDLSYTRQLGATTAKLPIEPKYQVVDQFSSAWPRPRATLISVSGNDLYQGKPHANKVYFFQVLLEYMPGNVLSDYDPISGPGTITPSVEVVAGVSTLATAAQRDASGNLFINGNAMVLGVVGYCRYMTKGNEPEATFKLGFDVKSYLNSASAQNQIYTSRFETSCNFATPIEMTIEDTFGLKNFFGFSLYNSFGTAEGVSSALGGSDVNVGQINRSGDLAFRIASGPFGTRADWVSHPFSLPEGWIFRDVNWKVKHDFPDDDTPKARSRSNGFQDYYEMFRPILNLPADYSRDVKSSYADNFVIGGAIQPPYRTSTIYSVTSLREDLRYSFLFDVSKEKGGMPYILSKQFLPRGVLDTRQNIKGSFVSMDAQRTAVNDHRVTTFLDSIKILAPRGSTSATGWISGVTKYRPDDDFKGATPFGPTLPEYYFLKDGPF